MLELSNSNDEFCSSDPDSIDRFNGSRKIIKYLDLIWKNEDLSSSEKMLDHIKKLSLEDFKSIIFNINMLVRNTTRDKSGISDEYIILDGSFFNHATPDCGDKNDLLEYMYNCIKSLNNIDDIALIIATGINSIHLFEDGNGRTSRLIYFILTRGYSGSTEDTSLISKIVSNEGREFIDISPLYIKDKVVDIMNLGINQGGIGEVRLHNCDIDAYDFSESIPIDLINEFLMMVRDSKQDFALLSFVDFIIADYNNRAIYVSSIDNNTSFSLDPNKDVPDSEFVIDLKKVVINLNELELKEILEYFRSNRRRYVEVMFDSLKDPNNFPLEDSSGWNMYSNIKDYFLNSIFSRHRNDFFKSINRSDFVK